MAELLWVNHHRAPPMDRRTIHGTVRSVTDWKYCTNSSGCYLSVTVSTPVFTSYSIINVQLAQSFKRMSCSHAGPLRNKFSASIVRCQKL